MWRCCAGSRSSITTCARRLEPHGSVRLAQLAGSTVGLLGLGRIGRRVAARLRGFDVELLVHDPAPGDASTRLDELLQRSDVISIHCPLTASTRHLIDDRALRLMRPGAILVNTARGEVVDEAALVDALRSGGSPGPASTPSPSSLPQARRCWSCQRRAEPSQRRAQHRVDRRDDAACDAIGRRGRQRRSGRTDLLNHRRSEATRWPSSSPPGPSPGASTSPTRRPTRRGSRSSTTSTRPASAPSSSARSAICPRTPSSCALLADRNLLSVGSFLFDDLHDPAARERVLGIAERVAA